MTNSIRTVVVAGALGLLCGAALAQIRSVDAVAIPYSPGDPNNPTTDPNITTTKVAVSTTIVPGDKFVQGTASVQILNDNVKISPILPNLLPPISLPGVGVPPSLANATFASSQISFPNVLETGEAGVEVVSSIIGASFVEATWQQLGGDIPADTTFVTFQAALANDQAFGALTLTPGGEQVAMLKLQVMLLTLEGKPIELNKDVPVYFVPEPASLLMLATLAAIGLRRRRCA